MMNYNGERKGNDICVIHKVKRGDTLYRISKLYHIKISAIIFANPYMDIYNLQPEDEILIPKAADES